MGRAWPSSDDRAPSEQRDMWAQTWRKGHMDADRGWSGAATSRQRLQMLDGAPSTSREDAALRPRISDLWPPGPGENRLLVL